MGQLCMGRSRQAGRSCRSSCCWAGSSLRRRLLHASYYAEQRRLPAPTWAAAPCTAAHVHPITSSSPCCSRADRRDRQCSPLKRPADALPPPLQRAGASRSRRATRFFCDRGPATAASSARRRPASCASWAPREVSEVAALGGGRRAARRPGGAGPPRRLPVLGLARLDGCGVPPRAAGARGTCGGRPRGAPTPLAAALCRSPVARRRMPAADWTTSRATSRSRRPLLSRRQSSRPRVEGTVAQRRLHADAALYTGRRAAGWSRSRPSPDHRRPARAGARAL